MTEFITLNAAYGQTYNLTIQVTPWTEECGDLTNRTYYSVGETIAKAFYGHVPCGVVDAMFLFLLEKEGTPLVEESWPHFQALIEIYKRRMGL